MRRLITSLVVVVSVTAPVSAGWVIQRPDGTYRVWNANTKDDVLQPGETWIPMTSPPTITSPAGPDVRGFTLAVTSAVGGAVTANALRRQYPNFFDALQLGQWADARALLDDALATAFITQALHDSVLVLAATYHIPL